MLNVTMLGIIMLSVIMLCAVMLIVVMLNVIMLSALAPKNALPNRICKQTLRFKRNPPFVLSAII
jgi:hypothetical protein